MGLTPAQRWGEAVKAAMGRRGYTHTRLAHEVGIHKGAVSKWVRGECLPRHDIAVIVSEHLMEPTLASLSMSLHTLTCPIDDVVFVKMGQNMRGMYCSSRCRSTALRRRGRPALKSRSRFRTMRLRLYQDTVDAYCRACEPEGVCRTAECPLREVSPLPLGRMT